MTLDKVEVDLGEDGEDRRRKGTRVCEGGGDLFEHSKVREWVKGRAGWTQVAGSGWHTERCPLLAVAGAGRIGKHEVAVVG